MSQTGDMPIADLMPHRPPMLLVTRVVSANAEGGEAEACIGLDSPFALRDGLIDEAVHFELIAQAFAACMAVHKASTGEKTGAETGYLTLLRSLAVLGEARSGTALRITVRATARVEDFVVVDGGVSQDNRPLASCQVTIFIPKGPLP